MTIKAYKAHPEQLSDARKIFKYNQLQRVCPNFPLSRHDPYKEHEKFHEEMQREERKHYEEKVREDAKREAEFYKEWDKAHHD